MYLVKVLLFFTLFVINCSSRLRADEDGQSKVKERRLITIKKEEKENMQQ